MNRASGGSGMPSDPLGTVLGRPGKALAARRSCSGRPTCSAYTLMATNRETIEQIADALMERKEMHGDEVVDLLDSVGLVRPEIDLNDDRTWASTI